MKRTEPKVLFSFRVEEDIRTRYKRLCWEEGSNASVDLLAYIQWRLLGNSLDKARGATALIGESLDKRIDAILETKLDNKLDKCIDKLRQRIEALEEENSSYSLETDSFDSPDGRTHSYEALFDKIEKALLSELKQGKQSPTAKKVHKIMDQFRQEYP